MYINNKINVIKSFHKSSISNIKIEIKRTHEHKRVKIREIPFILEHYWRLVWFLRVNTTEEWKDSKMME